jgi:probable phosphoglycerate mutase
VSLRLLLVRHGLSSFNLEQRIQGRDDLSDLSEEGHRQARAAGEALRGLAIDRAYASPLRRARDTALELLAAHGAGLTPDLDDDLLEVDLAPWCGLRVTDLRDQFPDDYALWASQPERLLLERPDGSRYAPIGELMDQSRRFLERLLADHPPGRAGHQTVLVVAHNAILRCLLLSLLGLDGSGFRRLRVDNASLSVLNLSSGSDGQLAVQIESLNGTSHLHSEPSGVACPQGTRGAAAARAPWRNGLEPPGPLPGADRYPLNANGQSQAAAAGRFLAGVSLQRAYTSSMARPRQTAEAILRSHPGVPLTSVRALVEIGHGEWEGRLEQEIAEGWPELLAAWKVAPDTVQMPGGETIQDVLGAVAGGLGRPLPRAWTPRKRPWWSPTMRSTKPSSAPCWASGPLTSGP